MPLPDVQSNRGGGRKSRPSVHVLNGTCLRSRRRSLTSYLFGSGLGGMRYSMLVKETIFAFSIWDDSLYLKLKDHTEKRSIS